MGEVSLVRFLGKDNFTMKLVQPPIQFNSKLFRACALQVSEGIDFKDHQARAVVLVGIPYPSQFDPQVLHEVAVLLLHRCFSLLKFPAC